MAASLGEMQIMLVHLTHEGPWAILVGELLSQAPFFFTVQALSLKP